MKIRTTKYIIKEGLFNAYKNKLMSLASLSIVSASLMILGIFLLLVVNLNHNLSLLKGHYDLEVFCYTELDDTQVKMVRDSIKNNDKILQYSELTKKEVRQKYKEKFFNNNEQLMQGLGDDFFPISFKVKLKNTKDSEEVVNQYKAMPEVEKVSYDEKLINAISGTNYLIPVICTILLLIFLAVSIFIISNTIKLTVFSRRKEINIMKYIGATDWFIRWPFVVEGIVIGLLGAFVSFIIIAYGYSVAQGSLTKALTSMGFTSITIQPFNKIGVMVAGMFAGVGAIVGAIGSMISIRKHLHV